VTLSVDAEERPGSQHKGAGSKKAEGFGSVLPSNVAEGPRDIKHPVARFSHRRTD